MCKVFIIYLIGLFNLPAFAMQQNEAMFAKFREFYKNNQYTDFCLVSKEAKTYFCHKVILAAYSDFFSQILQSPMKEAQEGKLLLPYSNSALDMILLFIYDPARSSLDMQGTMSCFIKPIDFNLYRELVTFAEQAFFGKGNSNIERALEQHKFALSLGTLEEDIAEIKIRTNMLRIFDKSYDFRALLELINKPLYVLNDLVSDVAFSWDGNKFLTVSGKIKVWNAVDGTELVELVNCEDASCAAFSPNGEKIVSVQKNGGIHVWNALTGEHILALVVFYEPKSVASFSPNNLHILTTHLGKVKVWDASTGQKLASIITENFDFHGASLARAAYSPDGRFLAVASKQKVKIFDASSYEVLHNSKTHFRAILSLKFSPDSSKIVIGSESKRATIIDAINGMEIGHSGYLTDFVYDAEYSPDGDYIITSPDYGVIWDAHTGKEVFRYKGRHETYGIKAAIFSPKNDAVALIDSGILGIYPLMPLEFYAENALAQSRHVEEWLKLKYYICNYLRDNRSVKKYNLDDFVRKYQQYSIEETLRILSGESSRLAPFFKALFQ